MRLFFENIDKLRRATVASLPAFSEAVLSQFQHVIETCNAWSAEDHNDDGTHQVIRIGGSTGVPLPTVDRLTLYKDGNDLKVIYPDGTMATIQVL